MDRARRRVKPATRRPLQEMSVTRIDRATEPRSVQRSLRVIRTVQQPYTDFRELTAQSVRTKCRQFKSLRGRGGGGGGAKIKKLKGGGSFTGGRKKKKRECVL